MDEGRRRIIGERRGRINQHEERPEAQKDHVGRKMKKDGREMRRRKEGRRRNWRRGDG
jgi:hypothetical protein